MMRAGTGTVAAALAVGLLLSGCTSTERPQASASAETTPETVGGAFETIDVDLSMFDTAATGTNAVSTFDVTDTSGYTFTASFTPGGISGSSDIENAKPGQATVKISGSARIALTNTSTGRNAPAPPIAFAPLYPVSSPVCAYSSPWDSNPAYCSPLRAMALLNELAVGASAEDSPAMNWSRDVAETEAQALVQAFSRPAGWAVGSSASAVKGDCHLEGFGLGQYLVWSSIELGCGVPVFDPTVSSGSDTQVSIETVKMASANIKAGIAAHSSTPAAEVPESVIRNCPFGDENLGSDLGQSGQFEASLVTHYYSSYLACSWSAFGMDAEPASRPTRDYIEANMPDSSQVTKAFDWASGKAMGYCYPDDETGDLLGCGVAWTSSGGGLSLNLLTSVEEGATVEQGFQKTLTWFRDNANSMLARAATVPLV